MRPAVALRPEAVVCASLRAGAERVLAALQGAVARWMSALLLGSRLMRPCVGGRTARPTGEAAQLGCGSADYAHGALA